MIVPADPTALHEFIGLLLSMVCREKNISSLMGMRRQRVGRTFYAITAHREDSHRNYSETTSVSPFSLWCVKHVPPSKETCTLYSVREKLVRTVFWKFL